MHKKLELEKDAGRDPAFALLLIAGAALGVFLRACVAALGCGVGVRERRTGGLRLLRLHAKVRLA